MSVRVNLFNFDARGLSEYFVSIGEKPFRAKQVMQWIHHFGVTDINLFSNISKSFRQKLLQKTVLLLPEITKTQFSADGTCKWLLRLSCGNSIETVFIPENHRGTLCVSSQVGCALNCSFCLTGKQGFNRNLTVAEIIGQVFIAVRALSTHNKVHDKKVTNIVMMGMGEPLLNFDAVVTAMNIMMDAYGLSKRRVTLSTSGIIPAMKKLSETSAVSLAVSLHAPNDVLRNKLVPINKKYNLSALMSVCKDYFKHEPRRKIMFEYVMLKNINDQETHAHELVELLKNIPAKVNLIPFNTFSETIYQRSSEEAIDRFEAILTKAGIFTITRKTRGDDIGAACGQLDGKITDITRRSQQNILKKTQTSDDHHEKIKKNYLSGEAKLAQAL